jgi:hypothetical protein
MKNEVAGVTKFLDMRGKFEGDGFNLDHVTLIRDDLDAHFMTNAKQASTPTVLHQNIRRQQKRLDGVQVNTFHTLAGGFLRLARYMRTKSRVARMRIELPTAPW